MNRWRPALLVALAALAGHAAWVVSRLVRTPPPAAAWVVAAVPVALWLVGMLRRSPLVLLGLVPVSWALPAYLDDPRAFAATTGIAAVCTLVAYIVAAAVYLGPARPEAEGGPAPAWQPAPVDSARPADPGEAAAPWLSAVLVVGPGLGVLLLPGLEGTLRQGFGPLAGLVGAGLAVLGTLLGLAFATDLHRPRAARIGSPVRVLRLGFALALLAAGALWLR